MQGSELQDVAPCGTAALGFAELPSPPLEQGSPRSGACLVHGPGRACVSWPWSPPLGTLSPQPALAGDAPSLAGLLSTHL